MIASTFSTAQSGYKKIRQAGLIQKD